MSQGHFKQIYLSFLYFFIFLHCKYYVISIITPIQKIFVLVVVTLQLGSVRHQQRHNPLAYMAYICLPLSLQCIVGRFSNTAVFGCFVSGDFVAVFWTIFLVIKANQDQSSCFSPFNLLCE